MKKRYVSTGIAVAAFILLFLYANVYEVDVIPEPGLDKPVQIAATANADVKALAWQSAGAPELRLEAAGTGPARRFSIVKPRALRADSDVAAGIINTFSDLQSYLTIAATETASFGIGSDSPRFKIETGSATTVLTLGHASPVGGSVYIQKQNDPNVYVVNNGIVSAFRKTISDLRDKALFTEPFTDVASVTIVSASMTIELAKTPTGWNMLAPAVMPADAGEVSALIYGIHDLKADRFIEETTPEADVHGLDKPSYRVVMRTPAGQSFELAIGSEADGLAHVRRSGDSEVYLVSLSSLAPLRKDFTSLRTKDLPAISPIEINKISVEIGTESFNLSLASDSWVCNGRTVEKSQAESVLQAYAGCRVQEFLSVDEKKAHGLGDAKSCDRLVLKSGTTERVVLFGNADESGMVILLEGENEPYRVPVLLHESIKALAAELRKKPETVQATAASATPPVASSPPAQPVPNTQK